jgi:hypothetical protein
MREIMLACRQRGDVVRRVRQCHKLAAVRQIDRIEEAARPIRRQPACQSGGIAPASRDFWQFEMGLQIEIRALSLVFIDESGDAGFKVS